MPLFKRPSSTLFWKVRCFSPSRVCASLCRCFWASWHPSLGKCCADLRGRRSLSGWWSLNGRLWTMVCNRICSVHSSSESCDLTRCCTSGSGAFVVSRPVSPVSSASPVLVGGVGGSRVGFGVGFSRCGVEGGLSRCLRVSAREMGGGAPPGSTISSSFSAHACCPTGSLCTKGGVSSPAEDLLPVSEVETGVNFRPTGGVGGRLRVHYLEGNQAQVPGWAREGAVTPSLHPEVPGIQFVSPGHGLDIRQSMGWSKVCETAQSGIWVLKGNASARVLPANLDHLRVGWRKQGSYETAWVTPGHDCLCSYAYGHGAAARPQTNDAIWHGVIGLWGRVAPHLSPWCARREVPTGVNLNQYAGPGSRIRWHSDNEPLFAHRMRLSS